MPAKTTQRERSERTARQILEAARAHFAADGYAGTSIDAVVGGLGMTKGAFYHHYDGKQQLFEAVFDAEQQRLAEAIGRAYAAKRDPIDAAYAAAREFFALHLDPGVQRITLFDAPSVMGTRRTRELESKYGVLLIRRAIERAIAEGRIKRRDPEALAHLLFGALCEGAIHIAGAEPEAQAAVRRRVEREFKSILTALDLGSHDA